MKIKKMVATLGIAASLVLSSFGAVPVVAEEAPTCEGKYVNIALVVDTTGSMGHDIYVVKNNLKTFVEEIAASGAIPRISLIDYKDYLDDGADSTVVHETDVYTVWWDDVEGVIAEIDTLDAWGGGDAPESVVDALGYVCDDSTMTFNEQAAKFAIVLTDIGYDCENRWGYTSLEDVANVLNSKGIQTTVVTHLDDQDFSYDDETGVWLRDPSLTLAECYSPLTTITNGTLIDMTDDFATELSAYAKTIIAATAEVEIDESVVNVSGITLAEVETGADVSKGVGGTYKIHATVTPADATNQKIIWSSMDEKVAVINKEITTDTDCYITAVAEGSATIVAKSADGGYTAYFTLKVTDGEVAEDGSAVCSLSKVAEVLSDSEATKVSVISDASTGTKVDEKVLADIFSSLDATEGKSVEFSFAAADGKEKFKWTFDGADITDASKSITDFAINPAASVPEVTSALESLAKDYGLDMAGAYTEIHFNHHGELPGKATVKVDIAGTSLEGTANGTKLYLYYYDPVTKAITEEVEATIEDGYAVFPISHCSDYILATKALKKVADQAATVAPASTASADTTPVAPTATKPASPKTGDTTTAMPIVMVMLLGAALVTVGYSRRRVNN